MPTLDPQYTWILLCLPLAIAAINWLFLSKKANIVSLTSTLSCFATLVISIGLLGQTATESVEWLHISPSFSINIGYLLDPMSTHMMVVVTGVGFLVHLFSLGYMRDDADKARYFTGLSLFMFSMTGIVLANNLAMTFVAWELVGFCSYLLIGFYYRKNSAADASKKAFITNRVGDFGFLAGILLTWAIVGSLNFSELQMPTGTSTCLMTLTVLCLFCGAVGKSAQFPLHVWLPDAMEGPTPVSALIHAATMVAAGVYMMVRIQYSMGTTAFTETACTVITVIGAITAIISAFMATQQNDIKRILAYSTLSQLGYMVMAVGLLAGDAAMFHLYTHAWFKALLFLGAGAIIFACHHEQDIWKLGGILRRMKGTSLSFLLGTAALIAIPGTSGFFSKESILVAALEKNPVFFWIGAGVALLTAFYMTRLVLVVFFGKERSENAGHAREVGGTMLIPLLILAVMAVCSGYGVVAEKLVPHNDFTPEAFHAGMPFYVSLCALGLGVILGLIFYAGSPVKDKLSGNFISRSLANRLYIDCFYDKVIIKGIQGSFAAIVDFIDQFIISGLLVGGSARIVMGVGAILRRIQCGNLAVYAVIFAVGILTVIYFMVYFVR
ncbi:MAG: NADH-quinone oxidoreductase subunit L [Akkermansia sp.]